MRTSLPLLNAEEARFECIYGRGCDGLCCQNGRPPVYPEEEAIIDENLERFLPLLRPEARALVEREGFLSNRRKDGQPMLRVIGGGWVFFTEGCVRHRVGAAEGDRLRYKPALCALFPLAVNEAGEWYIRQWGFQDEEWDLFCLDPKATRKLAVASLDDEIRLAAVIAAEKKE